MSSKNIRKKKNFKKEFKLLLKLVKSNKKCKISKIKLLKKAFRFSLNAHKGQDRMSGEPYFVHPINTAIILAEVGADCKMICAGLLHDVLEDTSTSTKKLKKEFGKEIVSLVEGVTKLSLKGRKNSKSEIADLKKLLSATTKDIKVLEIKLADKLHNVRTLNFLSKKDQKRIANDVINVYAPLANRLGMRIIERELQDLCFMILKPKEYSELLKKITPIRKKKIDEISTAKKEIRKALPSSLKVRYGMEMPGVYYLHNKVKKIGSIERLHGLAVLRIITKNTDSCYRVLGTLHSCFMPLPRKLKDFIAVPGPNLYQAIHTTVIGPSGSPMKVYILTEEMVSVADRGIIAFVSDYDKKRMKKIFEKKFNRLERVMKVRSMRGRDKEFLEALKTELLDKATFVFDVKGNKFELPTNATAMDFVYTAYPSAASRCWKLKINGKLSRFDKKINAGDMIEVIFSTTPQINSSWLEYVKTHNAKSAISIFLKKMGNKQKWKDIELLVHADGRFGIMTQTVNILSEQGIRFSGMFIDKAASNRKNGYFKLNKKYFDKIKKAIDQIRKLAGVRSIKIMQ